MPAPAELETKFWKALSSDMTVMLGLSGTDTGHARPMTGQIENGEGPIWFFTSTDSKLLQGGHGPKPAMFTFVDKGHDMFACVHGNLSVNNDRAVIDRLWNPYVAAWYEDGKDDPKLVLLRFDPAEAELWEDKSSLLAGLRMLMGADPKVDYRDSVAKVDLS